MPASNRWNPGLARRVGGWWLLALVVGLSTVLGGCATPQRSHAQLGLRPQVPRPHPHALWVKGHWTYQNGHYHWVNGYWRK